MLIHIPRLFLLTTVMLTQVAAQLGVMRDENRKMWDHLAAEKKKSEKLVGVVGRLWEVVNNRFPGSGQLIRCLRRTFKLIFLSLTSSAVSLRAPR